MTLSTDEFLRRFLLHVLPRGFVRIRHFGFLAVRHRRNLIPLCRTLSQQGQPSSSSTVPMVPTLPSPLPLWLCPCCGGPMSIIDTLTAQQIRLRCADRNIAVDSS
jgi:hypothetical protein